MVFLYFLFLKISFISSLLYTDQWFFGGYQDSPASVVRITIAPATNVNENQLPAESLTVFPNPASDMLNLDVNLTESGKVNVGIINMNGQVVRLYDYGNLQNEQLSYNISDLSNGTYIVRLVTEKGTRNVKFVVAK